LDLIITDDNDMAARHALAGGPRKVDNGRGVRRGRRTRRSRFLVASPSPLGKVVADPDGVELGFVAHADDQFLEVGEGPNATIILGRRYVGSVAERVLLKAPVYELFANLNVVDRDGEFVGVVRDTIDMEDVFDSIVVEDEEGRLLTVLLEDIRLIDDFVELSTSGEQLAQQARSGG